MQPSANPFSNDPADHAERPGWRQPNWYRYQLVASRPVPIDLASSGADGSDGDGRHRPCRKRPAPNRTIW